MATMRAAVYHFGNNNLVLEHVPRPTPGPGQVLIKVAAAGVCHSDTFFLSDMLDDQRTYIYGHENVGYAVELGANVKDIAVGKLYAVHDIVPHAKHALPGLTPFTDSIGIGENGGFAEYMAVDASQLILVPDGLTPEVAALAADSLITVYNALHNVAQLRPENKKRVLIYGVGGLGHQAIQLAKHLGATVYAVDYKPAARELALKVGAERAFHPGELQDLFTTMAPSAERFAVDVVIDFVATTQSFQLGQEAVKGEGFLPNPDAPHGLIVIVGVSGDNLTFSESTMIVFRTHVLTSLYGSKSDLKASLDLLAKRVVVPVVSTEPLENVNVVLDELRASRVTGRKVIVPSLGQH